MNHPEVAKRFETAMELSGITTVTKLSKKSGVERAYIYRLLNGEIGKPHKYVEPLAKAMGVDPNWLGYGRGGVYDFERPSLRQGVFKSTVTVIPIEGAPFDIELTVPDIFNSPRHVPKQLEYYEFFYIPEANEYFPGNTLLTVEKVPRPGPGIYLTWYKVGEIKRIGCFNCFYEQLELKNNRRIDMDVIGRIRNMDYWKVDEILETGTAL